LLADKSDELREASSLRANADGEFMKVMAVVSRLALCGAPGVDAKDVEEQLDVLRPSLADDREGHTAGLISILPANGHVPVGLEPARESGLGTVDNSRFGNFEGRLGERACAGRDESGLGDLRTMRMKVHPHPLLELIDAQPRRRGTSLADRLDDMVSGRF